MTNPYYNPTGVPAQGAAVTSAVVRTEFTAIQAGFDKMPTLSGNGNKLVKVNAAGDAMTVSAGIVDAASSTVLTIDSSNNLLVGLTDASRFAAANNGISAFGHVGDSVARLFVAHYKNAASAPNAGIVLVGSRGTESAYSALASGDQLGFIGFGGDNGAAFKVNQASIYGVADEAWSATNLGTRLAFYTTPNGSTVLTERMRITNDGTITLGGTSTAPSLKVNAYTAGGHVIVSSGATPSISTNVGNLILSSAGGATSYLQLSNGGTPVSVVSTAAISTVLSVSQTTNALTTTYPRLLDLYHDFSLGSAFGIAWRSTGRYDWIGQMQTSGRFAAVVNTSATPVPVWVADSSGNLSLGGDQGSEQVRILRATADRWITMTGSNGGNPTIGTSAGSLAVSCPMVVSPGAGNTFSVANGYVDFGGRLNILTAQALPAGGSTSVAITATTSNIAIYYGSGAPTVAAACIGSLYLRSDGGASTRLYSANSTAGGAGSWSAITSA